MSTQFLDGYEEELALGPVQRDEALFLFALARVLRPVRVLEFGTGKGHSAKAFLEAGVPEVWSLDIGCVLDPALNLSAYGDRLNLIRADMATWRAPDGVVFDLVFFDGAHEVDVNMRAFSNLPNRPGYMLIHDTGEWSTDHMQPIHWGFPGIVKTFTGVVHQPEERRFARMMAQVEGYQRIDLHSRRTLRHGLTLLQRP